MTLGTQEHPLRVAVIGSGPSGFYATDYLLKQALTVEVDMFDRLPTPFGLVRGGVAPDHQKIKSVTKVYDKIAEHPNFRFYGNVTLGKDLTRADLEAHYHAVILAVGAQTDKNLGIAGESLDGSFSATEFVGWYNGHPDYVHFKFDLSQETAIVIGVGNVAMDVARILARTREELLQTDIADYALEALTHSKVKNIYVLGRRGAAQAAFTNPEIKELGEMAGADIVIDPADVDLDEHSLAYLSSPDADKKDAKNVEIMREYSKRPPSGKPKKIFMRFLTSPVEIIGTECVEAIKLVKNVLVKRDDGSISANATDQTETIPCGLVFRSVGYKGVPIADIPFDDRSGTIPNTLGRVLTAKNGNTVRGFYAVGWIKRGPSGIIGTNKPDAIESAKMLMEDVTNGQILSPTTPSRSAIEALLKARNVPFVGFGDWQILDSLECENGKAQGRPRVKFTRVDDMLNALNAHKESNPAGD